MKRQSKHSRKSKTIKRIFILIGLSALLAKRGSDGRSLVGGSYVTLNECDPKNEFKMHYKITGDQGKPVLVMIAGLGAGMLTLMPLARMLKGFRVLTYDPRGLFMSGNTSDYEFTCLAADLNELLTYLGIDKANILGWSLGGVVAQYFAFNYPEKVDHLIMLSTFTTGKDPASAEMLSRMTPIPMSDPPTTDELRQLMQIMQRRSFNTLILQKLGYQGAKVLFSSSLLQFTSSFFDGLSKQWTAIGESDSYSGLNKIKAPTLIIHGTDDRLVPYEASQILGDALVNTTVTVEDIPNGCHASALENPVIVGSIINKYLKSNQVI